MCYDVNVPSCSTNQCGMGGCPLGQSVCSNNQYNTQTVCPLNNPGPGLGPAGLARPLTTNTGVRKDKVTILQGFSHMSYLCTLPLDGLSAVAPIKLLQYGVASFIFERARLDSTLEKVTLVLMHVCIVLYRRAAVWRQATLACWVLLPPRGLPS